MSITANVIVKVSPHTSVVIVGLSPRESVSVAVEFEGPTRGLECSVLGSRREYDRLPAPGQRRVDECARRAHLDAGGLS